MIPVILSGGSGTRLWPLSRTQFPKQFCQIFEETLHASTIKRLKPFGTPWIISSNELRNLTMRDSKKYGIPLHQVLFEPLSRNTAPAIALLCHFFSLNKLDQEIVGFFPADHLIEDEYSFNHVLEIANKEAENNSIVLLGIKPTGPSTGYGYIQIDTSSVKMNSDLSKPIFENNIQKVLQFHEKPNFEKASEFIKSGHYFWNSGIFIFKIRTMIEAFETYFTHDWNLIKQVKLDGSNLLEIYKQIKSISIDYAIIEKLQKSQLSCVPCNIGWNDVGSWDAISNILGTTLLNKIELQAQNNFVHPISKNSSESKKYVFIDTQNLIVVDTEDALLVTKQGSSQLVKEAVEQLKKTSPKVTNEHNFELRPWGQFQILHNSNHVKSKILQVMPQEQLSYQSHDKREEHWIFTRGQGEVILNDTTMSVKEGSYIKIPRTSKHRIRNTGNEILELIEVQLGTYFGEDDIVRYQDDYQR